MTTASHHYEQQRAAFLEVMAKDAEELRLDSHNAERYIEAIDRSCQQVGDVLREQIGRILGKQIDYHEIRWIAADLARAAGRAVSSARVDEFISAQQTSHRTMLAALAAGGMMGAEKPEAGKALHDLFGNMLDEQLETGFDDFQDGGRS